MATWTITGLIVGLLFIPTTEQLAAVSGPRCLDCRGVKSLSQCQQTTECWPHEICFGEKILHSNGSEWLNFGCKTNEECDALGTQQLRRFDIELRMCQKCCRTRLCNAGLCNREQNLTACLSCDDVAHGQLCDGVQFCDSTHSLLQCLTTLSLVCATECYAEKVLGHGLHPTYNLGCAPEAICAAIRSGSVGKRHSVQKRSTFLCQQCCKEPGCNADVCDVKTTSAPNIPSTTSTPTTSTEKITLALTTQTAVSTIPPPDATPVVTQPATTYLPSTKSSITNSTTPAWNIVTTNTSTVVDTSTGTPSVQFNLTTSTPATVNGNLTTSIPATVHDNLTTPIPSTVNGNLTTPTPSTSLPVTTVSPTTETVATAPIGKDCWELRDKHHVNVSGQYTLRRPLSGENIPAWCDMDTDGGGWIVFQRRISGNMTFARNWRDFQTGFGDVDSEFWWGNQAVEEFSQNGSKVLRIEVTDSYQRSMYAEYENFVLSNNSDNYRLNIGGFRGSAGHIMYYFQNSGETGGRHAGQGFSTHDNDHDNWVGNCAEFSGGGFWHDSCCSVCLNGKYREVNGEMCMGSVVGDVILTCVQRIEMKFRPASVPSTNTDLFQTPPPKRS